MKTIFIATFILFLSGQNLIKDPPNKVLKAFNQKFPSALNIKWIEEDNITKGTYNGNKYVHDDPNTWKVDFLLGDRKTSARFDVEGHWLIVQQEIKLEDISVDEVCSAIKKDFFGCEIKSIKIYNSAIAGTWYDVEGKCGSEPKIELYDYIGLPFPPRQ